MLRLLLLRGPGAAGWAARYTGGYWSISGSPGHYTVGKRLLHGVLCPGRGSRPIHASASRLLLPALSHRLSARSVSASGGGSAPGQESGGASGKQATDPVDGEKKPNKSQQLKKVFKEYGAVGVSFHVGISLMSLGIFYLIVSSGVDITAVLLKLGFSEAVVQSRMAAGTSTFVLAYAIHKLFAPVRMSITVVSVPFIVRYFRKIGFFKPPAPKP